MNKTKEGHHCSESPSLKSAGGAAASGTIPFSKKAACERRVSAAQKKAAREGKSMLEQLHEMAVARDSIRFVAAPDGTIHDIATLEAAAPSLFP